MKKRGNFEDGDFEREWREALEDASETPPSHVWSNIERDLAFQQVATLKKKARVYQWASAAAVFLAAILGINYLITDQVVYTNAISSDEFSINDNSEFIGVEISDSESNEQLNLSQKTYISEGSMSRIIASGSASKDPKSPEVLHAILALNTSGMGLDKLPDYPTPNLERKMYIHPVVDASSKAIKKREESSDKFWTGVSVSSGSFDPNYQAGATSLLANSVDLASNNFAMANSARITQQSPTIREGMKAGTTNSLGLNFGMKITEKWILESGVYYSQSAATTQTNMVVESSKIVEPIAASSETKGVTNLSSIIAREEVVEYSYKDVSLDNQFQFASLPLKAGYIVIDGQFSVIINAGVSTNLYLGNKLTDPESVVANVSIGPGESSPYREISFAGLGGLQLGYNFLHHFDLTVEPYLRQPITSLTKDNSSFIASPSGLGINTGIKYRFN